LGEVGAYPRAFGPSDDGRIPAENKGLTVPFGKDGGVEEAPSGGPEPCGTGSRRLRAVCGRPECE